MHQLLIAMPIKYNEAITKKVIEEFSFVRSKSLGLVLLINGISDADIRSNSLLNSINNPNITIIHNKFINVYELRWDSIKYFLSTDYEYLMMLDPDDKIDYRVLDKIAKKLDHSITKLGCYNSKTFYKCDYPRFRNFALYHLWNTIFARGLIKERLRLFEDARKYNIQHAEDFLINRIAESKFFSMRFLKASAVTPVYENNNYSNFSKNTDLKKLLRNIDNIFGFFIDHDMMTDQQEFDFQYSKIVMETAMHCYKRILNSVTDKDRRFKDDVRNISYGCSL